MRPSLKTIAPSMSGAWAKNGREIQLIELALATFGGFVLFAMAIHHLRHFMIRHVHAPRVGMTPEEFLKHKGTYRR